jgi:microcin C transport system substrate-binding protein
MLRFTFKSMNHLRTSILGMLGGAALLLAGCGKSGAPAVDTTASAAPTADKKADEFPGMEADLQRTLKAQSNFYFFKTAADFAKDTQGLTWEDGADLPSFADPNAKKGGTMSFSANDFPGSLRSFGPDSNSPFRAYLLDYVSLGIVRVNPSIPGRIGPELASSWAVDRPNKTVYFRLDPEARWSDGVPFTTDDIVFSWYLFRSPLLDDPWLNDYFDKTFTALTIYDAHTFSATLKDVRPDIVARIGDPEAAMPPVPRHFFKDFGPDWVAKYNWRIMPTTGAYTMREEDIKRTSSVTLSHVKDFWAADKPFARGRFNLDRIRIVVIRDPDKAVEEFLHGDIDLFSPVTSQTWYSKFTDNQPSIAAGYTVKAKFYNRIPPPDWGLWLNAAKPPLDNINVRLGIQYATNFELVCQQYFRGEATLQKTNSDGYGWDTNPALKARPFDPDKARAYFAKAGFTQQGPDGILMNAQGQRLSFAITTIYKRYQDILVILKEEALKAGLEYTLDVLDGTTGYEKEQEKRHDISLMSLNRTVDMYPRYWETLAGVNAYDVPYLADGSPNPARKIKVSTNNQFSLADYDLDQLINRYDKAETMDEIKALATQIEQRIYDDAIWVNGWKLPFYWSAYRPWIKWPKDFGPMQNREVYQFWQMWIDPDEEKADRAAMAEGRSLPRQNLIYDKYKEP